MQFETAATSTHIMSEHGIRRNLFCKVKYF